MARFFSDWGAVVVDADRLAREVVEPGTVALAQVAEMWPTVITAQGLLDRAALARIVFADASARAALNAIIHPRVRESADARERVAAPGSMVVHVVPLLFESDFWKSCERTVLVVAPRATRLRRVIDRDGATPAAVEARMAAQIDPEYAARLADYVIDNGSDVAALEDRARAVYDVLRGVAAGSVRQR